MSRKPLIVTTSGRPGSILYRLLQIPPGQLEELFDFASLDDVGPKTKKGGSSPPAYQMRADAWDLVCSHRWRTSSKVILVGREASLAFGLRRGDRPLRWVEWGYWDGRRVAILPHPRGSGRWWRDRDNWTSAQRFLQEAAGVPLGDPQGHLEIVAED